MFYKDDDDCSISRILQRILVRKSRHLNLRVTSEAWATVGVHGGDGGDWTELRES